jgi:hypothetical protein
VIRSLLARIGFEDAVIPTVLLAQITLDCAEDIVIVVNGENDRLWQLRSLLDC